jgi:hypothetical protein
MNKIPFLAVGVIAALSPRAFANPNPDVVRVDIYRNFDINNPPDARPYTGYVGSYELPATDQNVDIAINFGQPFGLTTFAAVVTFTEHFSVSGLYTPFTDTSNGVSDNPYLWEGDLEAPEFDGGSPYDMSPSEEPVGFGQGFETLHVDFIADTPGSFGEDSESWGAPYTLFVQFPQPDEGNDPDEGNASVYLVPLPDAGNTFALLGFSLAGLAVLGWRNRMLGISPAR